jgi:hypothetical protein
MDSIHSITNHLNITNFLHVEIQCRLCKVLKITPYTSMLYLALVLIVEKLAHLVVASCIVYTSWSIVL